MSVKRERERDSEQKRKRGRESEREREAYFAWAFVAGLCVFFCRRMRVCVSICLFVC